MGGEYLNKGDLLRFALINLLVFAPLFTAVVENQVFNVVYMSM